MPVGPIARNNSRSKMNPSNTSSSSAARRPSAGMSKQVIVNNKKPTSRVGGVTSNNQARVSNQAPQSSGDRGVNMVPNPSRSSK